MHAIVTYICRWDALVELKRARCANKPLGKTGSRQEEAEHDCSGFSISHIRAHTSPHSYSLPFDCTRTQGCKNTNTG